MTVCTKALSDVVTRLEADVAVAGWNNTARLYELFGPLDDPWAKLVDAQAPPDQLRLRPRPVPDVWGLAYMVELDRIEPPQELITELIDHLQRAGVPSSVQDELLTQAMAQLGVEGALDSLRVLERHLTVVARPDLSLFGKREKGSGFLLGVEMEPPMQFVAVQLGYLLIGKGTI